MDTEGKKMTFRICIVEDNPDARGELCRLLKEYERSHGGAYAFNVTCFSDALTFLDEFGGSYDFIFMDIELPHMDGMEAVRRIREKDENVIVVFVTNMAQYAVKGYEVNALDFIVKPVRYDSFAMKMDRAIKKYKTLQSKDIWITERNNKRRLHVNDIKYVEVVHHSCIYHTFEGDFTTYDQLNNVCKMLEGAPFALCNRCFLVNLKHVTAIEAMTVTVAGEVLQVSRNKKKSFLISLNEFLGGK